MPEYRNKPAIERKVVEIVCDVLGIQGHLVNSLSNLKEDLSADSSELERIFGALEAEFTTPADAFVVPDYVIEHPPTVADIVQMVAEHISLFKPGSSRILGSEPDSPAVEMNPQDEVMTPLSNQNTGQLTCEICGYVPQGRVSRLRERDLDRHKKAEHKEEGDLSEAMLEVEDSLPDTGRADDTLLEESVLATETDNTVEDFITSPTDSQHLVDAIETALPMENDSLEPEIPNSDHDGFDQSPEIDQEGEDASGGSEELIPMELVVESSESDAIVHEEESSDLLSLELAPSEQSNRNLLISPWAVFSVGIGECGTKMSAVMNKKPRDLASRHPVFYPVHCSSFDTHAAISATLDDDIWRSASRMRLYPVGSPKLDSLVAGATSSIEEMLSFFSQAGGIGGIPYFGYLAFQQLFENDGNRFSQYLEEIEREYFRNDLWDVGISHAPGAQEPQVGGAIENVGLVTFNSARGGTGSGGTPVIHRFFADRCSKYGTNLALSINVSVMPTDTEKDTKPQFAKHAVACLYRLRNLTPVHGVIIASNERLETVLGAGNYMEENSIVQEMLTPLVVSPSARYTLTSATATIDQSDIRRYVWNEVGNDKWPGLCTIGMAEFPLSEFETDEHGAGKNYESLLETLVETASSQTTSEWESRPGETRFIAFLIAPNEFFGRRPFGLIRAIQSSILDEAERRIEGSYKETQIRTSGANSRGAARSMLGNVSLMNIDTADTLKLVIVYSNVRIKIIDELVEEGLERELSDGRDGWDEIGSLTQSQIDQLEIEQLSNAISRQTAETIVANSPINTPYPFQQ